MIATKPIYAAPKFKHESERIKSLHRLEILDSEPNPRFDDITQLVSDVFDVPIALVSLVDENRQWFLSNCGLDASETNRDSAFCAHALHEPEILVIENAPKHPIMRFNPLVTGEPKIKFYAGAVIKDSAGLPLGTLCIIDTEVRKFNISKQKQLIKFAQILRKEFNVDQSHNQARTRSNLATNIDPVTQTLINDALYEEVDRYISSKNPSVYYAMQLRITNLSTYGDAFGNFTKDQMLFEVCDRLSSILNQYGHALLGRDNKNRINVFFSPSVNIDNFCIDELLDVCKGHLSKTIATKAVAIEPSIVLSVIHLTHQSALFRDAVRLTENAQKKSQSSQNVDVIMVDNSLKHILSKQNVIAGDLSRAIDQNKLRLVYQPKVSVKDKQVAGYECLLRWSHPDVGEVSPLDIMNVAEQINLTLKLEEWVFEEALKQFKQWQLLGCNVKKLSINLTGNTLLNPNFMPKLKKWLSKHAIPRGCIDIEIVESSLFDDYTLALEITKKLKSLGISFSLDDFGTGFSNLSYLKTLPISTLKIDKSFINDIAHCEKSLALCTSIITMAKNLSMQSVAEGVETQEQVQVLESLNCDLIQGFFFSKPIEKEGVAEFKVS